MLIENRDSVEVDVDERSMFAVTNVEESDKLDVEINELAA